MSAPKYLITVDTVNKYQRYHLTCPEVIAARVNQHIKTRITNIGIVDMIRDLGEMEGRGLRFIDPKNLSDPGFVDVEILDPNALHTDQGVV